ncbi:MULTISPECIES: helix-turn-helix domain-containing protein [unclassified Roseateles]|uniref:helix-turn-helix domain-containing protein n=1 Tax=unclassified Roseateles TaxID=2626991 RepID=UPI000AF7CE5B|nr:MULTISPECIES: helix-turn-helix transcriptional regulator [unclassified Roseateles]
MNDIVRLSSDLGAALKQARQAAGMSITEVAEKAGRVRDVIYRLESGHDTSVASLFAVLSALQLNIRLEPARMPKLEEVVARFGADE